MPCMTIKKLQLKRAAFMWYCELFPLHTNTANSVDLAVRKPTIAKLSSLIQASEWNEAERALTCIYLDALRQ